ncbi:GAF domain-containing protein [Dongia mobilis]|uniref:GAF domain-containing protein n=1 Tax=Dongia mobilis TaxID=578943 RepID=A0A4R6WVN9_9PROT|nr:HD domain-containing phosphohydrolase [Dongia mobilis]TDQ84509.1 GAF domain-containing protein [Dongia mobilis]
MPQPSTTVPLIDDTTVKSRFTLPLHLLGAVGVAVLLGLMVSLFAWAGYRGSQEMLLDASQETNRYIREAVGEKVQRVLAPARNQLTLLSHSELATADNLAGRLGVLPIVFDALESDPITDALYAGYPNGEFILFRALRDRATIERVAAPPGAAFVVQSVTLDSVGARLGEFRFYGADRRLIDARFVPDYQFDPRARPWYSLAQQQEGYVFTEPYVFFTTKKVGATMATRSANGAIVVGIDLTLDSIATEIGALRTTPSSELVLLGPGGKIIGYHDVAKMTRPRQDGSLRLVSLDEMDVPVLQAAAAYADTALATASVSVAGRSWRLNVSSVPIHGSTLLTLVSAIPDEELFAGARRMVIDQIKLAVAILLMFVALGWLGTRQLVKPLNRLAQETKAIAAFDFRRNVRLRTRVKEVAELGASLNIMKGTIRRFLEIGHALTTERETRSLLDRVLRETIDLVACDGGAIFLLDEKARRLEPEVVRWRGDMVGEGDFYIHAIPLDGAGVQGELVALARNKKIGKLERRLEYDELDSLGLRALVERENAVRMALVVVPLFNRNQDLLGIMLLINAVHAGERNWKINHRLMELVRAVSGSAGIAIENNLLLQAQKDLMNALIQLIAGAIDAKSAYTGGHCARVPALTRMLAEAACRQENGPFADFNLSVEQWEAVDIGSWLHDCGKVTTPEYVVDKATKLETIYDRIHEVRMRFEVLKRDAEIAYWQGLAEGRPEPELRTAMEAEKAQLDADFAFIATCNEGGEFMDPAHIERLKGIAARHWRRTLSDRIGISYEEKRRKDRTPEPALPVAEPLLADRDDHITYREEKERYGPDNPWGFRLDVPACKMNRGEVYNLSIGRGTLTEEERFAINDHIMQTIIMLESLPLPPHLRAVPEIAGGHHEKMNGTGYPKRLKRDEMSPVARMMAIADVFEALTAADRPYKKAKKLSEAIKIMGFMKKDQHLDPDLLDLFLTDGVWKRYAEQFLDPAQIDEPDIAAVLNTKPAA